MSLNINSLVGSYGASFIEGFQLYSGSPLTANADGSYTLTSLDNGGVGNFEYANNGYPSSMVNDHDLGLPGSPAFQPGDITGESISAISAAFTAEDIVMFTELDYQGLPITSSPVGCLVVAYGQEGFLSELITGFLPTDTSTGAYVGKLSGQFFFISTTSLNTFDAAGNPITPVNSLPTSFVPVSQDLSCFASGTRIATPDGFAAVEDLAEGDLVLTAAGDARPVIWSGRRAVDCSRHPDPAAVWPVRIEAGAFGAGPERTLMLSPDHAVYLEGVLIPVRRLINGATIRQVLVPTVVYHHIQLPTHDVILAEGLPVESFLDARGKESFEGPGAMRLHPDFALHAWEAEGFAPLMVAGPQVERAQAALAEIAAGFAEERAAA